MLKDEIKIQDCKVYNTLCYRVCGNYFHNYIKYHTNILICFIFDVDTKKCNVSIHYFVSKDNWPVMAKWYEKLPAWSWTLELVIYHVTSSLIFSTSWCCNSSANHCLVHVISCNQLTQFITLRSIYCTSKYHHLHHTSNLKKQIEKHLFFKYLINYTFVISFYVFYFI